jgi:hypothetical protein
MPLKIESASDGRTSHSDMFAVALIRLVCEWRINRHSRALARTRHTSRPVSLRPVSSAIVRSASTSIP